MANETTATPEFPLPRWAIWVLCIALTPITGSVLYYAWKGKNPAAANYANRVSWISWVLWIGLYSLRRLH